MTRKEAHLVDNQQRKKKLYLKEIISGHARLTWDTGGDDDGVGVLESLGQRALAVSSDSGRGVDVREVGSDAWGIDDIVQGQMGDQIRLLQQQRQGLADTASSTANND